MSVYLSFESFSCSCTGVDRCDDPEGEGEWEGEDIWLSILSISVPKVPTVCPSEPIGVVVCMEELLLMCPSDDVECTGVRFVALSTVIARERMLVGYIIPFKTAAVPIALRIHTPPKMVHDSLYPITCLQHNTFA